MRRLARLFRRNTQVRVRAVADHSTADEPAGAGLVDVNRVLATAAPMLGPLVGSSIRVGLRLSPARAVVLADAMDVEHVLVGLSLNARDEMTNGGVLVVESAVVSAQDADDASGEAPGAHVRITVADTGRGTISAVRPSQTAVPAGTPAEPESEASTHPGPGLVAAVATVRRMGGTLSVHREPFVGTTVTVRLPLALPETQS
jgi:signal transduction histidine kinase